MRVLWVCNIMLPAVAKHLGLEASNKEGWLTGLSAEILKKQRENGVALGICFPAEGKLADFDEKLEVPGTDAKIHAFGFCEDLLRAEVYDERCERRLGEIMERFQPDLIHCFGTEFPHTLAAVKAFGKRERTLIGIQGLCSVCANYFRADLPDRVWRRTTFRDFVRRDDLRRQHEKYVQRGVYEVEAVQRAGHITGRTKWDKKYTGAWNPEAEYHFMNETLRPCFYEGRWKPESCRRHSLFLSQGDYPLKGLHYVLQAMPDILRDYPDAEVYVAGNSIIKSAAEKGLAGCKGKLKLESYGKYILQLMRETGTFGKIHFLGRLNAGQMKEQYLRSNVYVCASTVENSPNSVGEAMMLGVPTVCAEVGGIPDIFTGGVDGLTYRTGDLKGLGEAVKIMFAGGGRVDAYREAEREHARRTHDPQKNYERLMEIYGEIAGR